MKSIVTLTIDSDVIAHVRSMNVNISALVNDMLIEYTNSKKKVKKEPTIEERYDPELIRIFLGNLPLKPPIFNIKDTVDKDIKQRILDDTVMQLSSKYKLPVSYVMQQLKANWFKPTTESIKELFE